MTTAWIAALGLLALWLGALSLAMVALARDIGLVSLDVRNVDRINPGPVIGGIGPDLYGRDLLTGAAVSLNASHGHHTLVSFLSPTCMHCRPMVESINGLVESRSDDLDVVCVIHGDRDDAVGFARSAAITAHVIADQDTQAYRRYSVTGSPFVVLIDPHGAVVQTMNPGIAADIDLLVANALGKPSPTSQALALHGMA